MENRKSARWDDGRGDWWHETDIMEKLHLRRRKTGERKTGVSDFKKDHVEISSNKGYSATEDLLRLSCICCALQQTKKKTCKVSSWNNFFQSRDNSLKYYILENEFDIYATLLCKESAVYPFLVGDTLVKNYTPTYVINLQHVYDTFT